MTRRPPLHCALCGPNREPYCGNDCYATARAVDHAIPPAVDRAVRRDHSLCGVEPCSHCR